MRGLEEILNALLPRENWLFFLHEECSQTLLLVPLGSQHCACHRMELDSLDSEEVEWRGKYSFSNICSYECTRIE